MKHALIVTVLLMTFCNALPSSIKALDANAAMQSHVTLDDKSIILNAIKSSQQSDDWETRYIGLYFLSKLIDKSEALEYATALISVLLKEENEVIITQALWLLGKLVKHGMCIDLAVEAAQQKLSSCRATERMWALGLYEELVKTNNISSPALFRIIIIGQQDIDPLVIIQSHLLAMAAGDESAERLNVIKSYIAASLQSPDWLTRHFGIYFLVKLVEHSALLDYAAHLACTMLNDSDEKVRAQALWLLRVLVQHEHCYEEAITIAKKEIHSNDWRLRLGALDLYEALINQKIDIENIEEAISHCQQDSNDLVRIQSLFLGMYS